MSMEGSSTTTCLAGAVQVLHRLFILAFISLHCCFGTPLQNIRQGLCQSKLLFGSFNSDSLVFEYGLVVCWYVIHSQSLTLTSDDLIWSSCGNYYDHTSIVMKIIQKAAELWTAITGHESQHRQVNTWTWSQVTTHCDLSALNIMLGSKQH